MHGHARRLAGVIVSLVVLMASAAGVAGSAHAAPYTTQPLVSVSDQTPVAGQPLTITVQGFLPGENVRIELHSTVLVLATVRADANGAATTTVTLPTNVTGDHTIVAIGLRSGSTASIPITILAPGASGGGGQLSTLPRTGLDVVGLVATAAVLLVIGGILLVVSSRRRKTVRL